LPFEDDVTLAGLHHVRAQREPAQPAAANLLLRFGVVDLGGDAQLAVSPFPRREARAHPRAVFVLVKERLAANVRRRDLGASQVRGVGAPTIPGRRRVRDAADFHGRGAVSIRVC